MNESISRSSKVVSGVSGTGIEFGTITVFGSTFVNGLSSLKYRKRGHPPRCRTLACHGSGKSIQRKIQD